MTPEERLALQVDRGDTAVDIGAKYYHVIRTRVRDTSARHALGHPSDVGAVAATRAFETEADARREADAWNADGDWNAEVKPGRPPAAPCGRRSCARVSPHSH